MATIDAVTSNRYCWAVNKRRAQERLIRRLQRLTDRICRRYPEAERSHVYHTLVLLRKLPLERLNLSLTRAEKKPLYI